MLAIAHHLVGRVSVFELNYEKIKRSIYAVENGFTARCCRLPLFFGDETRGN
jgi:hypothetical protein